jgi:HD-GYP domain-containing protein (c-di-GMP phosphodiesterase class II)
LCLATDLGVGFPFQHGLHATAMTMRLCEILEVGDDTARDAYYASMLAYVSCTTDAAEGLLDVFAGHQEDEVIPVIWGTPAELMRGLIGGLPPPRAGRARRILEIARRLPRAIGIARSYQTALCEVAEMMAERLGLPSETQTLFRYLTDRWDGKGPLKRAREEEIPLALRIAWVARDAAYHHHIGGVDHAVATIGERSGRAFDPAVASAFVAGADRIIGAARPGPASFTALLESEPEPASTIDGAGIDRALAAVGDFGDLVAPALAGHSAGVAGLAARAAEAAGMAQAEVTEVRRAALVHDVGRVSVDPRVWMEPGPLGAAEWEQVRLHPYHTERILAPAPGLDRIASIARDHHERSDSSGYHRGVGGAALSPSSCLLAAADVFHAMTESRPHRPALGPDQAAAELGREANAGRLDPDAVGAVIAAAGQPIPELERPAGLTEREAEVIGLLARGLLTKQVARHLDISPKTVDTHIQNAYRKIGLSTRAAATMYAMEHGLLPSGELPIYG